MEIKIIGSNTLNGLILRKRIIRIVNNMDEKVIIHFIDNIDTTNKATLYINNMLVNKDNLPAEKDIVKFIKKIYKE